METSRYGVEGGEGGVDPDSEAGEVCLDAFLRRGWCRLGLGRWLQVRLGIATLEFFPFFLFWIPFGWHFLGVDGVGRKWVVLRESFWALGSGL